MATLKEAIEQLKQLKQSVQEILENVIVLDCEKCKLGGTAQKFCYSFCDFLEEFLQSYCSKYDCDFSRIKVVPYVSATPNENPREWNPFIRIHSFDYQRALILLFDDNSWIILAPPPNEKARSACVYGIGKQQLDEHCWKAKADSRCKAEEFLVALMTYLFRNFKCEYRGRYDWAMQFDDDSRFVCDENGEKSPIVVAPIHTVFKADMVNILFDNIHFLEHLCKVYSRR